MENMLILLDREFGRVTDISPEGCPQNEINRRSNVLDVHKLGH